MSERRCERMSLLARLLSDEHAGAAAAYSADRQKEEILLLQICYNRGSHPYLTGLAPVIPPSELSPPGKARQSYFERPSATRFGHLVFCKAAIRSKKGEA